MAHKTQGPQTLEQIRVLLDGAQSRDFDAPTLPISANVTDLLTVSSLEWVFYADRSRSVKLAASFRIDSPLRLRRCAPCSSRSRMVLAKVASQM